MAAPEKDLMWAGSEEIEVDREPEHLNDTEHLAEAVKAKLGLLHDTKVTIMGAEKGTKKRKYRGHIVPPKMC